MDTSFLRQNDLLGHIENEKHSKEYRTYLEVRESVFKMLDEASDHADLPSNYWKEELDGFDYMLDASPLVIRKLRQHCYHLTGLRHYDYRDHHAHKSKPFAMKLDLLREQDEDDLLVPESPLLGGFGHHIDGMLINLDTLKFYESMIALNKSGLLAPFRNNSDEKRIVLEIGAGWGGFAYQFKKLCPNTCYIIIDFPQTLLFSIVYLKTLFPKGKLLLYGDKPKEKLLEDYASFDFVFLPHFFWKETRLKEIELAINMVSFQEMTDDQVDGYVRHLVEQDCQNVYSHNRDRSSHNTQLSTVSSILGKYYDVIEHQVLDMQYISFKASGHAKEQKKSVYDYRHLIGTLKKDDSHSFMKDIAEI